MGRGAVRWGMATVIVVGCLGLAACGTPDAPPTPTPTGFASEDEAFAAAEETYRAYVDALNRVDLSDPETFEDVYAWTTGELNASDRKSYSAWHAEGYSISGDATVLSVEPLSVDYPDLIVMHSCYDVSAVDVADAGGESLVSPDRPSIQSLKVSFSRADDAPHGLLVSAINPFEAKNAC